ncbi:phosphohistidine phosphatase SixA [Desulfospira joergensenii]|uniref:phosphohistidine phosphatase SixA n=1 Tax=Desulfospira joergensenii TaxID=53329 RepID=UPI0003B31E81|nr:phosphohistidine phosphatase SixA [Desulfospira joergensenii]
MSIFLVQHGLSLPKAEDPEKGVSVPGREETLRIARVAENYKIRPTKILHSGKKRAGQTAEIFHEILKPENSVETLAGIMPMDDVKPFGNDLDPGSGHMIVGHLPFMEKLVSYLTADREEPRVLKFQNSGIVCMDQDEKGWFIKWTLNPDIS